MAPLLKTLTDSSEFDNIVSHQIINPHYVSTNFKSIESGFLFKTQMVIKRFWIWSCLSKVF